MGFFMSIGWTCWSIYFMHMLVCWTIRKLFDPQFGLNDSADENASKHGHDSGFDRTDSREVRSTRRNDVIEAHVKAATVDSDFVRRTRLEDRTVMNGLKIDNLKREVEKMYFQMNRLERLVNNLMIAREAEKVKTETKVADNQHALVQRVHKSQENDMTTKEQVATMVGNKGNTNESREQTTNEYMMETGQDTYTTVDSLERSEYSLSMQGRPRSVSVSYEPMENNTKEKTFEIQTETTKSLETLTETTVQVTNIDMQLENTNASYERMYEKYERFVTRVQEDIALINIGNESLQLPALAINSNEVITLPQTPWSTENVKYTDTGSQEWSEHSLPKTEITRSAYATNETMTPNFNDVVSLPQTPSVESVNKEWSKHSFAKTLNTSQYFDTIESMEHQTNDEEASKIETGTAEGLQASTETTEQLINNDERSGSADETYERIFDKYIGLRVQVDTDLTLIDKEDAPPRLASQAPSFNNVIPLPQTPSVESTDEKNSEASLQVVQQSSLNNEKRKFEYTQFLLRETGLVTYPAFGSPDWLKWTLPSRGSTSTTCDTNETKEFQTKDEEGLKNETETAEGLQELTKTTPQLINNDEQSDDHSRFDPSTFPIYNYEYLETQMDPRRRIWR